MKLLILALITGCGVCTFEPSVRVFHPWTFGRETLTVSRPAWNALRVSADSAVKLSISAQADPSQSGLTPTVTVLSIGGGAPDAGDSAGLALASGAVPLNATGTELRSDYPVRVSIQAEMPGREPARYYFSFGE